MSIENLLLNKDELPILHQCGFSVPIYPELLKENIKLDPHLSKQVFSKVVDEWYDELNRFIFNIEDKSTKKWIQEVFLCKKPKLIIENGNIKLDLLGWKNEYFNLKNGFINYFSISRDAGGSLFYNPNELDCKMFVPFNGHIGYIKFSKEKVMKYSCDNKIIKIGNQVEGSYVNIYDSHNIDNYPSALFLRNWAINYINECIKQIIK